MNAKTSRNGFIELALVAKSAHFPDLCFGYFCPGRLFATKNRGKVLCIVLLPSVYDRKWLEAFLRSISRIVRGSANKKMCRVDAMLDVALVADIEPSKDVASGQERDKAMRAVRVILQRKHAVAIGRSARLPQPAAFVAVGTMGTPGNFAPKPFNYCWGDCKLTCSHSRIAPNDMGNGQLSQGVCASWESDKCMH